jgi:hypothetical protein
MGRGYLTVAVRRTMGYPMKGYIPMSTRQPISANENELPIEMTIPIGKIKKEKYNTYSEAVENGTITFRQLLKLQSNNAYNTMLNHPDAAMIEDSDGENFIQDTINSLIANPIEFSEYPNLNYQPWEPNAKNSIDYIKKMTIPELFKVVDKFSNMSERDVNAYLANVVTDRNKLMNYVKDANKDGIPVKNINNKNSDWEFHDYMYAMKKKLPDDYMAEITPLKSWNKGISPLSELRITNKNNQAVFKQKIVIKDNHTFTSKANLIDAADNIINSINVKRRRPIDAEKE